MQRILSPRSFTVRFLGYAPSYQTLTSVVAGLLLLAFLHQSRGDDIPGLFNTGVLDNGSLAPEAATDLHYTLISTSFPTYSTSVIVMEEMYVHGGAYIANGPDSKWLRPAPREYYDAGEWVYRTTFDLTGLLPMTAKITGQCAADDGLRILINGSPVPYFTNWYAFLTPFTITNGFVAGTNTLDFVVTNIAGSSATAFRVDKLRGTAVDPNKPPLSIFVSEISLCWAGTTGKTYQVQYRSELTTNLWSNLGDTIPGTNGFICVGDAISAVQRFYRLQLLP
jgi:hypothetical protein